MESEEENKSLIIRNVSTASHWNFCVAWRLSWVRLPQGKKGNVVIVWWLSLIHIMRIVLSDVPLFGFPWHWSKRFDRTEATVWEMEMREAGMLSLGRCWRLQVKFLFWNVYNQIKQNKLMVGESFPFEKSKDRSLVLLSGGMVSI